MHHGDRFQNEFNGYDNLADELKKAEGRNIADLINNEKLGATGKFPEGKLNDNDEGEIKMAVGVENKKVIINFGKQVAWVGFSSEQARELAESLSKKADDVDVLLEMEKTVTLNGSLGSKDH